MKQNFLSFILVPFLLCGGYTLAIVPHGTYNNTFLGNAGYSGGSKNINISFIVRLFRDNDHPFLG